MLPWTRPEPHAEFEAEAKRQLDAVRKAIAGGEAIGKAIKGREIWSGSWRRVRQPKGAHKIQLAGSERWLAKCAWCEQRRELGREIDVEHYRPKAELTRWDGNPNPVSNEPPKQVLLGPGYWWLAFSWSNFTLACKTCNQHWKRNLFPLSSAPQPRVEGVETREQPLLLDPGSGFVTREHFRWDVWSGIVEGISDQGHATIITCGLNREGLLNLRGKAARDTDAAARRFMRMWNNGGKHAAEAPRVRLLELTSNYEEFTSMRRWIVERALSTPWEKLARTVLKSD